MGIKNKKTITFISIIILIASYSNILKAETKTPDDVYYEVQKLKAKVLQLREINNLEDEPWVNRSTQYNKTPRHVYIKSLEVLEKINRYRIIKNMGKISVPYFTGREITPNEVYTLVDRLLYEFDLLLPKELQHDHDNITKVKGKTSNDVYKALWEISTAIDPILGIRGFTPDDTFKRAKQITGLVKLLRKSQNAPEININIKPIEGNKHPNHALAEVNKLLERIKIAEQQLWMKNPVEHQPIPRRVITPTEVYDATGVALAELKRIEYRLGLDHYIEVPQKIENKTPNDVINEIRKATALMPDFSSANNIIQYDKSKLEKTPNHVFALAEYLENKLIEYRKYKNITTEVKTTPHVKKLQPKHVYQKALECLKKINNIRKNQNMGEIAVPQYPLRHITPNEVYDIVIRLDADLNIVLSKQGFKEEIYPLVKDKKIYTDKTPSDVYQKISNVSYLLDSITDAEQFSPDDVFPEIQNIFDEINIITNALNIEIDKGISTKLRKDIKPADVYNLSLEVHNLVKRMQQHAGMQNIGQISIPVSGEIIPSNVFDQIRLIQAELISLKVYLGISKKAKIFPRSKNKTPADGYQVLEQTRNNLQKIFTKK